MRAMDVHPIVKQAADSRPPSIIEMWRKTHRFDILGRAIPMFLDRGLDGARMVVRERISGHSVELRKIIHAKGQYGIQVSLQLSEGQFDRIKILEERCMEFGLRLNVKDRSNTDDFYNIEIKFGKNTDAAVNIAALVLADVYNLSADSRFDIETENVSRWREVIDSPDQEEATPLEGFMLLDERSREMTGSGTAGQMFNGFTAIFQLIGTAGLAYSLVFHTYALGIIFASLIVIGFVAIFTNAYWSFPKKGSGEEYVHVPKTLWGLFRVVLFRPFNWISIIVLVWALFTWASF